MVNSASNHPRLYLCDICIRPWKQLKVLGVFQPETLLTTPGQRLSVQSPAAASELPALHSGRSSNNRLLHNLLGLWLIYTATGELGKPINNSTYVYTWASWASDHLQGNQSCSQTLSAPPRRHQEQSKVARPPFSPQKRGGGCQAGSVGRQELVMLTGTWPLAACSGHFAVSSVWKLEATVSFGALRWEKRRSWSCWWGCPAPAELSTQPGLHSLRSPQSHHGKGEKGRGLGREDWKSAINVSNGRRKLNFQGQRKSQCSNAVEMSAVTPLSSRVHAMWFSVAWWRWLDTSRLCPCCVPHWAGSSIPTSLRFFFLLVPSQRKFPKHGLGGDG